MSRYFKTMLSVEQKNDMVKKVIIDGNKEAYEKLKAIGFETKQNPTKNGTKRGKSRPITGGSDE